MSKTARTDQSSVGPTLDAPPQHDRTTLVDIVTDDQRLTDWNVYRTVTSTSLDTIRSLQP